MVKIALFEDNPVHQSQIKQVINHIFCEPHTIEVYSGIPDFQAFMKAAANPADDYIIFMDIELGSDSGIALARQINQAMPDAQIIYITQYLKYVSSVYDSQHIFFMEKANLEQYLPRALEIAMEKLQKRKNCYLEFCWNKEQYQIQQKDIIYMERSLRTTEIHTRSSVFYTSEKLSDLEKRLRDTFVICHRSFLINLETVTSFKKTYVLLNQSIQLPVSRSNYPEVKRRFNILISK